MGRRTPYILITILLLVCFQSEATEKVELKPVKKSISKSLPYSAGFYASVGTTTYDYYMSLGSSLTSMVVGNAAIYGGCYSKLYLPQRKDRTARPFTRFEIAYGLVRSKERDSFLNQDFPINCHYVSGSILLGIGGLGFMERQDIYAGFSCDILVGFKGAPQSIQFSGINRECLNPAIPKLVLGVRTPIYSFQVEVPLNSGPIDLDKYTYYNRVSITSSILVNISVKIDIRAFGNTHK